MQNSFVGYFKPAIQQFKSLYLKKVLYALIAILLIGAFSFWIVNKPLPTGQPGARAEALADEILDAINIEAWDSIPIVAWSFRGVKHYVWDKVNHVTQFKSGDLEVIVNLNTQQGKAFKGGTPLSGKEAEQAIDYAYSNWCNDSFWLNAPAKIRDAGTERSLVLLEDGSEALLVKYSSGGVTPGDAYLWVTGPNGLPQYYRMWVSIIPLGGLKATWEDWQEHDGAMIAGGHKIGPAEVPVEKVRTGQSPADFDLPDDYFTSLQ